MSNERHLRKVAKENGYILHKGFVHYLCGGYPVFRDSNGNRKVGYTLIDTETNTYVWGSYNNCFDHLWSLQDVENYLKTH